MKIGAFKWAFLAEDLYIGLREDLLKNIWVKNRYKDRRKLAAKIFKDCFYEILLDIIENNVTFVLPLNFGNYAEIYMKQYVDNKFKLLYNRGKFNNIDYIKSEFTGNQIVYKYKIGQYINKEKLIYVSDGLDKKIIENTHNAKQYY